MGRETTSSQRIAEMMDKLNITQADIVRTTKIPKSTLSNYLSGKRTPDQFGLSVIADPYGINPAWLMGYDVPMFLKDLVTTFETSADYELAWDRSGGGRHPIELTPEEHTLILEYRAADDADRKMVERILAYATRLKEAPHEDN